MTAPVLADAGAMLTRIRWDTRSAWRVAYSIARTPPHECPSTSTESNPKWRRTPSRSSPSESMLTSSGSTVSGGPPASAMV